MVETFMAIKLKLTSTEILNNQFTGVPRGYSPIEVDSFLDSIIADYRSVEKGLLLSHKEAKEQEDKIKAIKNENENLKIQIEKYRNRFAGFENDTNVNSNNIDWMQRINKLEKALWKLGVDPTKI